jgi:hypothetical protein
LSRSKTPGGVSLVSVLPDFGQDAVQQLARSLQVFRPRSQVIPL